MKKLFLLFLIIGKANVGFSQTISFSLIRDFATLSKKEIYDKLNKQNFYLANQNFHKNRTKCGKKYDYGRYYSNDKERGLGGGEISFIVFRKNNHFLVTSAFYVSKEEYSKNYKNTCLKIENNFEAKNSFFSSKYDCEVKKYYNNGIYYYVFDGDMGGWKNLVFSDKRLDVCYFSNS